MKKKFGVILTLACLGATCLFAGCKHLTKLEEYQKQGYTIMVTYDANGGSFLSREGVTIVDLFKPSDHVKEDGKVHVKLTEPTDLTRPTSGTGNITLTMKEHFFVGWYENCELRKNDAGQVVDEEGAPLQEIDGTYYYVGTQTEAMPAYTYSDRWDFATDTIDYEEEDGLYQMTLYAAWVPYFEFEYYYRVEGSTDWTYLQTSTFDYKTTNAEGSTTHDKDTIWLPDWKDGQMNHEYRYANNATFKFPQIDGTTFTKAYTDADCTQAIDETSFVHQGTIDYEKGEAVNRIQKIYFEVEEGKRYKIETAEQFSAYAGLSGTFDIVADELDFKNGEVKWPASLTAGTFEGKISTISGQACKFKNVVAKFNSESAKNGGLFGRISNKAIIENITLENVTVDIATAKKANTLDECWFGLFAGMIDEGANIAGVTIGGKMRLGAVSLQGNYVISLLANGNTSGITAGQVTLEVYGKTHSELYQYSFNPNNVTVNQTEWTVTLDFSGKSVDRRYDFESRPIGTYEIE